MKRRIMTFMALAMLMPLATVAQNNGWVVVSDDTEEPAKTKEAKAPKVKTEESDAPYLAGAVPEVDGEVSFIRDIKAEGKSAQEIYETLYAFVSKLTKEDNQINSHITLRNANEHSFVGRFNEWMVFSEHLLAVDRTEFHYSLVVLCEDGHATIGINHISYIYSHGKVYKGEAGKDMNINNDLVYRAEDWISDRAAINKKGTKLLRYNRKFRVSTVDRINELFDQFSEALN